MYTLVFKMKEFAYSVGGSDTDPLNSLKQHRTETSIMPNVEVTKTELTGFKN